MYYKLSNTAERKQIEELFEVSFKYPNLYRPEIIINGLSESTIPVITAENPHLVSFAIWGILPENFTEDWSAFQNLTNTLHVDRGMLKNIPWCKTALKERRCLIVATGFFTTFIRNGVAYPYHVGLPSGKPFFIAGVYNQLNDGFLTSALVLHKANKYVQEFQSLGNHMPLMLPNTLSEFWLDRNLDLEHLHKIMERPQLEPLKANPIAKDFFNQNISYDSMLEPVDYPGLSEENGL